MQYSNKQLQHPLFKRLSVGLPIDATANDILKLFNTYGHLIHSIYTSPPYIYSDRNLNFTDKDFVNKAISNNPGYKSVVDFTARVCKKFNIKLDMVINSGNATQGVPFIVNEVVRYNPSEITVMDQDIDIWRNLLPNMTFWRSFNNAPVKTSMFSDDRYSGFIAAKQFLWYPEIWPKDLTKFRLLVNNACLWSCKGCHKNKIWKDYIRKDVKIANGINSMIARISMLPEDMKLVSELYPDITFKLNNRASFGETWKLLDDCEKITSNTAIINELGNNSVRFNIWHLNGQVIDYINDNKEKVEISEILDEKLRLHEKLKDFANAKNSQEVAKLYYDSADSNITNTGVKHRGGGSFTHDELIVDGITYVNIDVMHLGDPLRAIISELACSLLAKALNLDCADYKLFCRDGIYSLLSRKFYGGCEIFKNMRQINPESFPPDQPSAFWKFISNSLQGYNMNKFKITDTFYQQRYYDMLIGQTDRFPMNAGIVVNTETRTVKLAPLFDNECCHAMYGGGLADSVSEPNSKNSYLSYTNMLADLKSIGAIPPIKSTDKIADILRDIRSTLLALYEDNNLNIGSLQIWQELINSWCCAVMARWLYFINGESRSTSIAEAKIVFGDYLR